MNQHFEKIDAFLKGELTPNEMQAFQKAIEADTDLAAEVQLHRLKWEAMHMIREDNLRTKLKTWQKETSFVFSPEELDEEQQVKVIPLKKTGKRRKLISRLAVAASILLVIGTGSLYILSQQYSTDALFAATKDTPQLSASYKSPSTVINPDSNPLKEPATAFEYKKYDRAIALLEAIPADHPAFIKAQLYLGHAYFMKGKTGNNKDQIQKAISYYEVVLPKELDIPTRNEVEWYLLLAQLKTNKVDQSFYDNLETIANNENHRYKERARLLFSKINSFWYKVIH